jgi:hypothetical protein
VSYFHHVTSLKISLRAAKAPMTRDQLAQELHRLNRRNQTPLALIEMFDALFSLDPSLSVKQKRKISTEIIVTALVRLERKDA